MKRLLTMLIAVSAIGLTAGGCAQMQAIGTGFELATASINNPVTKSREAQIELALHTAIDLLNTYKAACVQGTADKNCKANIAQIQAYTRDVKPLVAQLRTFVDNNDQVNAAAVYNQLVALYANAKTFAATAGVNLGDIKS